MSDVLVSFLLDPWLKHGRHNNGRIRNHGFHYARHVLYHEELKYLVELSTTRLLCVGWRLFALLFIRYADFTAQSLGLAYAN
jgi:hypothetical protein